LNAALAALERHLGFPQSRSRGIARRLQDAGMLPLGAPGFAPQLDADNFVTLVIAVASDTGLRTTGETTRRYAELPLGGTDLAGAPASVFPRTARDHLDILIDHALYGDPAGDLSTGMLIECVLTWPEIAFHHRAGSTTRFHPVGTVPQHWQSHGHRRGVTIDGISLSDAVRAIFKKDQ
jgi:hypothetical protein